MEQDQWDVETAIKGILHAQSWIHVIHVHSSPLDLVMLWMLCMCFIITEFNDARGHEIGAENYLKDLRKR